MDVDLSGADGWANRIEVTHWQQVLRRVVQQERDERGVDEPASIRSDHGNLFAVYGPVKFLVASVRDVEELPDEDGVFQEVDRWIAFERPDGPGVTLDRDRLVIDAWHDKLSTMERSWPPIISKVMDDVEATTNLSVGWQLERRDEVAVLPFQTAANSGFFGAQLSTSPRPTRRLLLPELWLTTQDLDSYLLVELNTEDADDSGLTVAGLVE
jgi:hypothetical protein